MKRVSRIVSPERVARQVSTHVLIREARGSFLASRRITEGHFLRPFKKLLPDVTSSRVTLDRALSFASDLYNAIESRGYRVVLAPAEEDFRRPLISEKEHPPKKSRENPYLGNTLWHPYRPTVAYVGSVPIGLAVIEMTETVVIRHINGRRIRESEYKPPEKLSPYADRGWTSNDEVPSGRLRVVLFSPYSRVTWSMSFQETDLRSLAEDLSDIIDTMERESEALVEKLQQADLDAERRRQEWAEADARRKREEDRRCVEASVVASREQLKEVIQAWSRLSETERFLKGVEERATALPDEERLEVTQRLAMARAFLGSQDPMRFFLEWKAPAERYTPTFGPASDRAGLAAASDAVNNSGGSR
ncbi:MAG: hypothetical protein ING90_02120 [Rhodocyclaceae bacterium]|nr:hypothetical protein [Rhodocyclaceae bacterium]